MVSETLELIIRTTGGSAAAQQIGSIGAQAKSAAAGVNTLNESFRIMRQTLVALSFIRVFEGIAAGISQAQQINNQLLQISKTAADVPKAFNMFSQIALATHAPLAAVTSLGVQITRSSASYKMGAKDIADATQTIFNTFRLNGSDPATISNVTKDLKEIFSLGIVQGRQFRAVILQDQAEALLLAKYIHASGTGAAATNKELDAIRAKGALPDIYETAMKHKGAFTGRDVLNANIAGSSDVSARVAQLPTTLGQAFTDLQTKWLSFLNTLNNSGAFQPVVNFVEYLANNLPTIGIMITSVAAAWASWMVIGAVSTAIYGLVGAFGAATKAVAAFFSLSAGMASFLVLGFIAIGAIIAVIFGDKLNKAAQAMGGWGEFMIRELAMVGAVFQTIFGNLGATFANAFIVIGNGVTRVFQFVINAVIDGINLVSTKLNDVLPKSMQLGSISQKNFGQMANPYAAQLQGSFQQHAADNYKVLEGAFGSKKTTGLPNLKTGGAPADENGAIAAASMNKQTEALQGLENMLSKFGGPAAKYTDDIDKMTSKIKELTTQTTNAATGKITPATLTNAQVAGAFEKAGYKDYNATTHESATFNNQVAESVMGLTSKLHDLASAQTLVNKYLADGGTEAAAAQEWLKKLTTENNIYKLSLDKSLEGVIKLAQYKFNEAKDTPDKIQGAIATKAFGIDQASDISTYNIQLQTLNQMQADGKITNMAYAKSVQDIQKAFLDTQTDGISGFQKGLLDVQQTMFNTSNDAAKVLTDSFDGLQNALVTFAETGTFNVHKMAMSILADFDTLIVKQAIMQPLMTMMGIGPGSTLGIGQANGGLGGFLGGLLGGSGAVTGTGQLGAAATNPMWVSIATNTGDIFGGTGGTTSGSTGGVAGLGGGSGGPMDMFSSGGLLGSQGFFSNLFSGTGGGAGSASSSILSGLGDLGGLFGFASGGSFGVGGVGATDSQLVAFRASPDETVTVQTPQQQRSAQKAASSPTMAGGMHLHLHGVTDADSFKKSKGQIATGIGSMVNRGLRRNGQ